MTYATVAEALKKDGAAGVALYYKEKNAATKQKLADTEKTTSSIQASLADHREAIATSVSNCDGSLKSIEEAQSDAELALDIHDAAITSYSRKLGN